jgi:hypothetical protein
MIERLVRNEILKGAHRPVNWIHMPGPINRDDDAYFAPLRTLRLPKVTDLYFGLLHHEDGVAGAQRRMATASRHVQDFGIATECGMGSSDATQLHSRLMLRPGTRVKENTWSNADIS